MNTNPDLSDDLLILDDEPSQSAEVKTGPQKWNVLIVDDEPDIHSTTKLVLKTFEFAGRALNLISAYSGKEAQAYMTDHNDVALILLDVVMENDSAGLQTVNFIRNELGNKHTRIVLRTGQPGLAPEEEVIKRYDIEDYKNKTELTVQKLHTTVTAALRTYQELQRIEALVLQRTEELQRRNDEIMQSIRSAQRIQTAILPSIDYIGRFLNKVFVYYQPKDIVSGDLYWFWQQDEKTIIANIDCSGHGVPGAIMSIFAYNLLNQTVGHGDFTDPAELLGQLDQKLMLYLNEQGQSAASANESFDANILFFNHNTNVLEFAGANRPLFYFKNGGTNELFEYPGDKFPVGDRQYADKKFTKHSLSLEKGDRVFVFTDGIVDQFGQEAQRRFSLKRLKEVLALTKTLSLDEQHAAVVSELSTWKGSTEQTDDICFISMQPL